jgi:hypothetical protein
MHSVIVCPHYGRISVISSVFMSLLLPLLWKLEHSWDSEQWVSCPGWFGRTGWELDWEGRHHTELHKSVTFPCSSSSQRTHHYLETGEERERNKTVCVAPPLLPLIETMREKEKEGKRERGREGKRKREREREEERKRGKEEEREGKRRREGERKRERERGRVEEREREEERERGRGEDT